MLSEFLYEEIKKLVSLQTGTYVPDFTYAPVSGGSINQTYRLTFSNAHTLFCKINSATAFPNLFLQEQRGLQLLAATKTIKTATPVAAATLDDKQVLLLQWIEPGTPDHGYWKKLGEGLAQLHANTHTHFGLAFNNYMGAIPQNNTPATGWIEFFIQQRLEPLIQQALQKDLLEDNDHEDFKKLYKRLPHYFDTGQKPALLHGDLWRGNVMCNSNKLPVLIDPAPYYGHPAIDLGMTTLFGGFDPLFYEAYLYHAPQPPHYKQQWQLCMLYPLLIHLLLFGTGYKSRLKQTLHYFL